MFRLLFNTPRRIAQGLFLGFLLLIPLRLFCVDIPGQRFIFLGMPLGVEGFVIPALSFLGSCLLILFLSYKKARIFCAWLCPVHLHLELVNNSRKAKGKSLRVFALSVLGALLGLEILLSFLWPPSRQIAFVLNPETRVLFLVIVSALWGLFFALLFFFKEVFCIRACPYGLIQLVIQGPNTKQMNFRDPQKACIHCSLCGIVCPMGLEAKRECRSLHCTGCRLCEKACVSVLGRGKGLFELSRTHGEGA
ncbi:MAG: 4Fe-4S binding protein [Planctomycetes bacterium]|nr:4Fe-4S binding protein [Planctomycetota bacterium]